MATDEDIITIHLGRVLPENEYKQVVEYLISCLNVRYPNFNPSTMILN